MHERQPKCRSQRSRLTWGVILLVAGGCLLAANLGLNIPDHLWNYWPFLLIGLGLVQVLIPGNPRDRWGGYWLVVFGLWGTINMFEFMGLHWGNSWPIFVIAAGFRALIGGLFERQSADSSGNFGGSTGGSTSQNPNSNQDNQWSRK
jgi:Domain of unknown function (DUF5668)